MEIQEIMYQILSLKLYSLSSKFQIISLENSFQWEMTSHDIEVKKSHLHIYVERITYERKLLSYNMINFFDKHDFVDRKWTPKF